MSCVLVISEWGVVVVRGAPSLSVRVVVCGRDRCLWGWALSLVGTVVIRGAELSFAGAVCRCWVLCVVEGRLAVVWGW